MTFNSSSRAFTVAPWSAATRMQLVFAVSSSSRPFFKVFTVTLKSLVAVARDSSFAALLVFSSAKSLLSAASWSLGDCASMSKLCLLAELFHVDSEACFTDGQHQCRTKWWRDTLAACVE